MMAKNFKIQKYDYIDHLRGIAILGVVFAHLHYLDLPFWTGSIFDELSSIGGMGVPLFFIISAYTLCLSYNSRSKKEVRVNRNFFIRRFFRIYPLFLFINIVVFVLFSYFSARYTLNVSFDASISNLLYHLSFLFGLSPNYISSMYMGEWSLFNEAFFYLFFPLLYYLSVYKRNYVFIFLFAVFSLLSYGSNIFTNHNNLVDIYGTPITHMYSFLIGIGIFKIKNIDLSRIILRRFMILNISLFFILTYFYILHGYLHVYPGFFVNLGLTLFLFIKGYYQFTQKPVRRFLRHTGLISYSLYLINLWFYIIMGNIFILFIPSAIYSQFYIQVILMGGVLVLLFLLSRYTYTYIELKGMNAGKKIIEKYQK